MRTVVILSESDENHRKPCQSTDHHSSLKLKAFQRFQSTADALEATTALLDGELSKSLSKFLKKEIVDKELEDKLITADTKMGGLISKKLKIEQFGGVLT